MLRFALCCALFGTILAARAANAFVVTQNCHHCFRCATRLSETSVAPSTVDSVVECIHELYPPQGLDQRIALSRKDGYWPFISTGEDPPQELVYGEFDVGLLDESLQKARQLVTNTSIDDSEIVFCDLGSGTGRLVLAAAALYPNWKQIKGIELLESIYQEALETLESCRQKNKATENDKEEDAKDKQSEESEIPSLEESEFLLTSENGQRKLQLAPIELECGSFTDPYGSFYDADILFCFSSCLPQNIRIELARSIGRQSRPGTVVITTEYPLPAGGVLESLPDDPDYPTGDYEFELVESFSGNCTAVGGTSTVYIQRVTKSLGTGTPRFEPKLPLSEIAYRAIQYMEENDSTIFLRQVSNQMAFLGFPDSWLPKI